MPGPIATIQLANFRRGLQDHQYLTLARRLGLDAVVSEVLHAIVPRVFSDAGDRVSFPETGDPYEAAPEWKAMRAAPSLPPKHARPSTSRSERNDCRRHRPQRLRRSLPVMFDTPGGRSDSARDAGLPARQSLERRHLDPACGSELRRHHPQHRRRQAARLQPGHELRARASRSAARARSRDHVSGGIGSGSVSDSVECADRELAAGAQRGPRRTAQAGCDAGAVPTRRAPATGI